MKLPLPVKMILVLVVIAACSGLILSSVWNMSAEKIAENEQKNVFDALKALNPTTHRYEIEKKGGHKVFKCYDKNDTHIANFFMAQGDGYVTLIKAAISVEPSWKRLIGVHILEQSETPGLGAKITEKSWTQYFENLTLQKQTPITVVKGKSDKSMGEISAITGATISSKAVADLVSNQLLNLQKAGF